jgi:citrate lyase subunit beta/citryl-CoA lyase
MCDYISVSPLQPRIRTLLFAPANRADLVAKLHQAGADAVVLDLEDGTPAAAKSEARLTATRGVATLSALGTGPCIFVRTNAFTSGLFADDLAALISPAVDGLDGLVIPKVESWAQMTAVERLLTEAERRAGRPPHQLVIGIESAAGVEEASAILSVSTRTCAVYFGAEDLATDLSVSRTPGGMEVAYARSRVALAAARAGVAAIDQAVVEIRDDERFRQDAAQGHVLGYGGKLCLHPRQVELAHQTFRPSAAELAWSRRLIHAYDRSVREGRGTLDFEGRMVDLPLVDRARQWVEAATDA